MTALRTLHVGSLPRGLLGGTSTTIPTLAEWTDVPAGQTMLWHARQWAARADRPAPPPRDWIRARKAQVAGPLTVLAWDETVADEHDAATRTAQAVRGLAQHLPRLRMLWLDEPGLATAPSAMCDTLSVTLDALAATWPHLRWGLHPCALPTAGRLAPLCDGRLQFLHVDLTQEDDAVLRCLGEVAAATGASARSPQLVAGLVPADGRGPLPDAAERFWRLDAWCATVGWPRVQLLAPACGLGARRVGEARRCLGTLAKLRHTIRRAGSTLTSNGAD